MIWQAELTQRERLAGVLLCISSTIQIEDLGSHLGGGAPHGGKVLRGGNHPTQKPSPSKGEGGPPPKAVVDEGHLSQQGFPRDNVHDVTLAHLLIHGRLEHTLSPRFPSSAPFGGTFPLKGGRLSSS